MSSTSTYQATVFIKLQNFNGDASGNLQGNYGIYTKQADTVTPAGAPLGPMPSTLGNFTVTAQSVAGQDPRTTLDNALNARTDLPTLTEI